MSFTTNIFLFIFLPVSLLLFCILNKFQNEFLINSFLIICSLVFYGWACFDNIFVFVIFVSAIYCLAQEIERSTEKRKQRVLILAFGLCFSFAILFYYKYYNFSVTSFNQLLHTAINTRAIIAPLGISFIIFSSVSYLMDVYRGDKGAGTLMAAMLYLTFFPKVISGPIVLWKDFSDNLNNRNITSETFSSGIERVMIGFAKKTIIADTLGGTASTILTDMSMGIDSITAWGGALCYMLQIYYDFSGYSDIAIGISRLFGFTMNENFDFPYTSTSITEFWRRWHISLGRWFKEYLYFPLGGNRKGNIYLNLFIVFMATGIWHGASWNFILWGFLNAVIIVLEKWAWKKTWYQQIPSVVKRTFTSIFVYFSWIVFMTKDISQTRQYISIMFGRGIGNLDFTYQYYFNNKILTFAVIGICGAIIGRSQKVKLLVRNLDKTIFGCSLKAILFMVNSTYSPFLYFQF